MRFIISHGFTGMTFALLFALGASMAAAQSNPVPLINQPLVPDAVAPGGPAFTLTVNGTGFVSASVVNWNGSARDDNIRQQLEVDGVDLWPPTLPRRALRQSPSSIPRLEEVPRTWVSCQSPSRRRPPRALANGLVSLRQRDSIQFQ